MASLQVRVLTYNIRHGLGTDKRQDLSRILPVLVESRADIVCLQEVDYNLPRSGQTDQAAWLARNLGFHQALGVNFGIRGVAGMGNAILSRWPIYSTWNKTLPFRGERRGLLMAEIDAPASERIAVFCTHWGLSAGQRLRQAEVAAGFAENTALPCLLCGDLNARPGEKSVATLLKQSNLEDAGPNDALTYPADHPESKIDYILASRHFAFAGSHVIDTQASDHLPLVADLSL